MVLTTPPQPPPSDLMGNLMHMGKLNLLAHVQTGNFIVDAMISTLVFALVNYLVLNVPHWWSQVVEWWQTKPKHASLFLDGKRYVTTAHWTSDVTSCFHFTNRFRAMLYHVQRHVKVNPTIKTFVEFGVETRALDNSGKAPELFMIWQAEPVQLTEEIFAQFHWNCASQFNGEDTAKNDSGNNNNSNKSKDATGSAFEPKVQQFRIQVFSHTLPLHGLTAYVDRITEEYLEELRVGRDLAKNIYTLEFADVNVKEGETIHSRWNEVEFSSSRTFQNLFFDGKKEILEKIDFFLQNKDWYFDKGIPYTLGIGLHGPPGTGKTSFIKALANYTSRHLVIISLKLVKTRRQLESVFYQMSYRANFKLGWDQKIIVFEDIDCLGDIVVDREIREREREESALIAQALEQARSSKQLKDKVFTDEALMDRILELNMKMNMEAEQGAATTTGSFLTRKAIQDEGGPLTLDDLLNLWDGIKECPARMMVITSNFYHRLDKALVRPGRIDITHELRRASAQTVADIYQHLYGQPMDPADVAKVPDYQFTPAELMNAYFSHRDPSDFVRLFSTAETSFK